MGKEFRTSDAAELNSSNCANSGLMNEILTLEGKRSRCEFDERREII
jgi:hypothetical protein